MSASVPIPAEPQHFPTYERLLCLSLMIASVLLFWRRSGPILYRIRKSKKNSVFHLTPITNAHRVIASRRRSTDV
jgi:hypothetical protein